jgi:hypothetical protein
LGGEDAEEQKQEHDQPPFFSFDSNLRRQRSANTGQFEQA